MTDADNIRLGPYSDLTLEQRLDELIFLLGRIMIIFTMT